MQFFKRLELHGFKSFANKTTIDFLPGVTVIVGPNGCGKSNVFDSIRWVLGEQSAKSMRGSRMGDVIFNGSGSLKALGMARVNLVLNNDKRTVPIDFDEVAISRRLFRTGESEYMLNNSNCRLKDLVQLFMDTGIGTNSYSVMEQGKVDQIINSKPLERRALFDEAAGISKYKVKKDEALHKLARTDEDLLRLNDVINEVRRQANSLKRQASKAERYKRLSAELRTLEMEMLVRRYYTFRDSTSHTEALFQELSAKVTALRTELNQIGEVELESRTKAEELQQALEVTQELHFEVNRDLQQTMGQIALFEQRQATSEERRQGLFAQINDFDQQTKAIDETLQQLDLEITTRTATLGELRESYAEKKAHFDTLKSDSDSTATEMASLRQNINTVTRQRMEKDNEARLARVMETKIADELGKGDAEHELLREQVEALTAERNERKATAEQNEQVLGSLRTELQTTREGLKKCDSEFSASQGELETARRNAQLCRSRHDALVELQDNFEGYFRGVKEVMLASKSGRLRGILGVVSTLIEANKDHELAIETALGGQAQDVIVETAENGKAAIRLLKESKVGRATFLPLDLLEAREASERLKSIAREPGVIGIASRLVKFSPKIAVAVEHLLGGTIVVQNLDVAVGLERRGYRAKFVTLEGEMVTSSGAMTGGFVKAAGLLHRTREVKELAQALEKLRATEQQLTTRVVSLKDQLAQLRDTYEKLARQTNSQEVEAARSRKDFEMVEHKLSEKLSQMYKVESRRAEMEKEIATHREIQDKSVVLLEELSQKLSELEAQLAEVEAKASAKQYEVAEFTRELNELKVSISTGEERLASLRERLADSQRQKARLASVQADRQREIEQLEKQQETSLGEVTKLKEELEKLRARQQEINSQISEENKQKEVLHGDLRKLSERGQMLQRDLNEAQNNLHEVEIRRTEYATQLNNIALQAQEKFSMELEEVIGQVRAEMEAQMAPGGAQEEETKGEAQPAATEARKEGEGGEEQAAQGEGAPGEAQQVQAEGEEQPEAEAQEEQAPVQVLSEQEFLELLRSPEQLAGRIGELRSSIESLGPVHVGAIDEYNELNARHEFLVAQDKDLVAAKTQLTETIQKIDETTRDLFTKAFAEIRHNFEQVYRRLFGGGRADLVLTEENGVLNSGIDIIAQPPGKKPQHISLLSGGEKALTAIALLFAIFMRKPSPFCILDEIDAPLDDKNIERFKDMVREFTDTTQFIIITHNKTTMALANTIYGVTMQELGVSRVVSLRLDEYEKSDLAREVAMA